MVRSIFSFLIFSLMWEASANAGFFYCSSIASKAKESASVAQPCEQIRKDIAELRALKFSNLSVAHKKFFGTNKDGLYLFLIQPLGRFGVYVPEAKEEVPSGELAVTMGNEIAFLPIYFTRSKMERLGALIHEARHLRSVENPSGFPHVTCPNPFVVGPEKIRITGYDGERACDASDDGAYAAAAVFLRSVANACINCNDADKKDASNLTLDFAIRILDWNKVKALMENSK